jgi:hypothetical protein
MEDERKEKEGEGKEERVMGAQWGKRTRREPVVQECVFYVL